MSMASEDADDLFPALAEESADARECLTAEELHAALGALSTLDLKRLRYSGYRMTKGLDLTADAIVSDAIYASLIGRRHCPRDVPVAVFLYGVMKSLAWSARKTIEAAKVAEAKSHGKTDLRAKIVPFPTAPTGEANPIELAPDSASNPEQALLDREDEEEAERIAAASKVAVQMLNEHFSDDYEVQLCIAGMMDGLAGKELRDFVGVDQAGLDHAKKKVRRADHKLFPRGWRDVHH
jgi:hypothetical protein